MSSVPASTSLRDARDWLSEERAKPTSVERLSFGALDRWSSTPPPARLVHASGGFFSIDRVRSRDERDVVVADRAFVRQPEIGILGFLSANIDGAEHLLVQAKFEPGNIGGVQFAPTVQATMSNYRRLHGGAATPFLEYFLDPPSEPVCDFEQPEQPAFFIQKRNDNVVVALERPIDPGPMHRWIRSSDVVAMLADDNAINMHARSVFACLRFATVADTETSSTAVAEWLDVRSHAFGPFTNESLALDIAPTDFEFLSEDGTSIVIAVAVRASEREVAGWMQPMLTIRGRGLLGLLVRNAGAGTEMLCQALRDPVAPLRFELGPTLIRYGAMPNALPFAGHFDESTRLARDTTVFDALNCEAGGRFYAIESRYTIVLAAAEDSEDPPPDFRWFRVSDVAAAVTSGLASSELRSLIACLPEEYI